MKKGKPVCINCGIVINPYAFHCEYCGHNQKEAVIGIVKESYLKLFKKNNKN